MLVTAALILLKAALLTVCLMAPDLILRRSTLQTNVSKLRKHVGILFLICLPLASAGLNIPSITAVAFLVILNTAWQMSFAYFGVLLRADDLILLAKPDHFRDVVSVGRSEFRRFSAVFIALGASLAAALAVMAMPPHHYLGEWAGIVAWIMIFARTIKVAVKDSHDLCAHVSTPGAIGALHALAVAIAWQLSPVKPLPGKVSYRFSKAKDVTIAVIMGESINPSRMDIFKRGLNLTPNLLALAESTGPYRLIVKRGLSAGVASNASVTGFLGGSPFPWRAEGSRSVFDLATQQGFETFYWSAQTRSPIELLDGGRFVGSEHCFEHSPADFAVRKDWLLVDKLNAYPPGRREFFFVYPRCNHSPYFCHGRTPSAPAAPSKTGNDWLVHNYDLGMREFDKLVSDLLAGFRARASGDLFVFITSDHNELLGEGGLAGHTLSDHAIGALVPSMLYTNRPDHPVAQAFNAAEFPSAFFLSSLVMSLMGVEPEVEPEHEQGASYVCNGLPFARSGFMRVLGGATSGMHEVEHFNRAGEHTHTSTQVLPTYDQREKRQLDVLNELLQPT